MNKIIIRMVLNTEDEERLEEVKQTLLSQKNLGMENISFSPMRPYFRYADYGEISISLNIKEESVEDLKNYLSSYWQGEYEDDLETDQIMGTLFHPNVYYMNLQIL